HDVADARVELVHRCRREHQLVRPARAMAAEHHELDVAPHGAGREHGHRMTVDSHGAVPRRVERVAHVAIARDGAHGRVGYLATAGGETEVPHDARAARL